MFLAVGCKKKPTGAPEGEKKVTGTPEDLRRAAEVGNVERIRLLVSDGVEIDARDRRGRTPLFLALWNGHASVARLLVASGADVNAMDRRGYTPLLCAFRCDNGDMAALLIERGAAVDVWSRMLPPEPVVGPPRMPLPFVYKNRPLHYAAFGYKKVVELLLAKGAHVNVQNDEQVTPLHEAVSQGHRDVAGLLIDNGADINAATIDGRTPMDIALAAGQKDLVEFLRSKGGDFGIEKDVSR
jgi:ankyrin repeat protein